MKTKLSTRILAWVLMLTMIVPMLVFNASAADTKITFNLGANGSATHKDGSSKKSTYTETVDGYTLSISGGTNMYPASVDAKGNSCIKFGSSSAVGGCTIAVPADVTSVVLHVAKYKANTTKITVNGKAYTLTNASNNGAYDAITVDTTTTKTITFTTVSGGVRAMLNTVEFIVAGSADEPMISLAGDNVLQAGNTVELTATLTNLEGNVEWTTDNADVATVEGGVVTGVAMGTATITASVGEVQQTKEITVYPAEGVITVEQAIEIANFAGENGTPYTYQIVGVVESIDTAYSEQHGNITVTICDENASIYVYRMSGGADLQVGQKIIVSGKLQTYSGKPQVSQYSTYELILDDSAEAILEALNALELKMSLAYKYETSVETVTKPSEVADTLDNAFTVNSTANSYSNWSGKTGESGAVYAGNSAGGNSAIQMRSNNNNSGIVTTVSGGKIKSITITWNTNTSAGRKLNIYGSNTAYTAATELYASGTQGALVTSFTYAAGTTTQTYEFTGDDYAYIGIRSNSGALYIDSIVIEWAGESDEGETVEQEVYKNSQFAFRFGVDNGLTAIEGVEAYGLVVSAGDKDVYFSTDANSWTVGDELCYVTVSLGDIINDTAKLSAKFTVKAYVEVEGIKYYSEGEKTYSVVDMIEYYYGLEIPEVTHLYDYLVSKGLI